MSGLRDKLSAFDASLPLAQARTIPAAWYFDPEIHAAESRAVFGAAWQVAGRAEQVAAPGAFLTVTIADEPIVVVRGSDNVRRAFYNVCRHRAGLVVTEPEGSATRLRCRYHGWTYDLAGQLRGAPEFDGVADFCREDAGLAPLAAATWGPFVWVHMGKAPAPLAAQLAPLADQVDVAALRWHARRSYDLDCNWKVYVDNYLDGGYHVNTVHPALAGALDYAQYRTELFPSTSLQSSPLKPSGLATRSGGRASYWWAFPNFMLNLYAGVMDTNVVLPLGPQRCRVIFDFFFAAEATPSFIAESIAVAEQVQQEDMGICAEVQRGLASRAYDTGRFSVRREAGGYHFHQLLAQALRSAVV